MSALNPDAYAYIVLQAEYRSQMDRHANLRRLAAEIRADLERTEADALTAAERAGSIVETLLRLTPPRDGDHA